MSIVSSDSNLDNVLATIYSAALGDHSEWNHVLEVISKQINASHSELSIDNKIIAAHPFPFDNKTESSPNKNNQHNSQLHQHPVMQKLFFQDQHDINVHDHQTSLNISDGTDISATMVFNKKHQAFSTQDIFFLEEIKPHINRALRINQRLKLEQRNEQHLFKLFNRFLDGILLLDAHGSVQYANPSATLMLSSSNFLKINSKQELIAKKVEHTNHIQTAVRKVISHIDNDNKINPQQNLLIEEDNLSIKLSFISLISSKSFSHLYQKGIVAAIFLHPPQANHHIALDLLKQVYNLNGSETMLCAKFVNHPSIEACAEALNLSENSVRTYLKKIYEKTGQNSQAGLMRLLMSYVITID